MKYFLLILALLAAVAGGYTYTHQDEVALAMIKAERQRNGLETKTIEVDGETWPYLEGGSGEGRETILMIHGFSADKDNWTRFAGHFVGQYHVIAPDLPGFGDQARHPGWDYRLAAQIERLRAIAAALGVERFHMVGNSMGGHITALYALTHPEQIISASLFDNAGIASPEPSLMRKMLAEGVNPLLTESVEDFARVMDFTMEVQPFVPWPVRPYIARKAVAAKPFNDYIFGQIHTDRASGLGPVFGQIKPPVQILWGRQDRCLHVSSVEVMKAALPSAQVVIMEETGHLPMIERPAESAAHYLEFLESVSGV